MKKSVLLFFVSLIFFDCPYRYAEASEAIIDAAVGEFLCNQQRWSGAPHVTPDLKTFTVKISRERDQVSVWSDRDLLDGSDLKGISELKLAKITNGIAGVFEYKFVTVINKPEWEKSNALAETGKPYQVDLRGFECQKTGSSAPSIKTNLIKTVVSSVSNMVSLSNRERTPVFIPDFDIRDPYTYVYTDKSDVYLVVFRNGLDPSGMGYLREGSLPVQPETDTNFYISLIRADDFFVR